MSENDTRERLASIIALWRDSPALGAADAIIAAGWAPRKEADDWLPIETAPHGTPLLVCGGTYTWDSDYAGVWYPFDSVTVACWNQSRKAWQGAAEGTYDEYYWHRPEWWRPNPTPKTAKPKESDDA